MANIDTSGCHLSCEDCPREGEPINDGQSYDPYACDTSCKVNWCEYLYQTMLDDVSLGGQYGLVDFGAGPKSVTAVDALSIFSGSNCFSTPGGAPTIAPWQHPCTGYQNGDGTPSLITRADGSVVSPENSTLPEFIANWQPSWAKSLVCYHPEYCAYEYCQSLDGSHDYYTDMLGTDTYTSAEVQGFLNPIGSSTFNFNINLTDPFFDNNLSAYNEIFAKLNNFKPTGMPGGPITMWEAAAQSVNCPAGSAPCNPVFGSNPNTQDEEWKMFRMFYISAVQLIQENYMDPDCKSKIDLIGSSASCNLASWGPKTRRTYDFATSIDGVDLTNYYSIIQNGPIKVQAQIQAHCQTTCESYIPVWKLNLANSNCFSNCGFISGAIEDDFYDALAGVCALGCDAGNSLGSSTTAPGAQYCDNFGCYTSFEEVFANYFPNCFAPNSLTMDCAWEVLNFPRSYGHNSVENEPCVIKNLKWSESFESVSSPTWISDLSFLINDCDENCKSLSMGTSVNCTTNFYNQSGTCLIGNDAVCHHPTFWQGKAAFPDQPNSQFMMVNGKDTCTSAPCAGWKVWEKSIPVGPPYEYEFSFWVKNLDNKYTYPAGWKDPKLEIRVNGSPITGVISVWPGSSWTQIKGTWMGSGPGTTALVSIFSYQYSSQNDFGIDEIEAKSLGGDCCLRCAQLYTSISDISLLYGAGIGHPNFWPIATTYMNQFYGFNYGQSDYEEMYDQCTNAGPDDSLLVVCPIDHEGEFEYFNPCVQDAMNNAWSNATQRYDDYLQGVKADFRRSYTEKCLEAAERFERYYSESEYQYTLYYYDLAGNLIQTVPPEGVTPIVTKALLDQAEDYRNYHSDLQADQDQVVQPPCPNPPCLPQPPVAVHPDHGLQTRYEFNSLNQVAETSTPDRGTTKFWYDNLGRPVYSQDARQAAQPTQDYSYTLYDALGRPIEAGQLKSGQNSGTTSFLQKSFLIGGNNLSTIANSENQFVRTWYDVQGSIPTGLLVQENLRNRVASIEYHDLPGQGAKYASHYSYDAHGNVKDLIQEIKALQFLGQEYKHMEYDYDLVGGNVNVFRYQPGKVDQWLHRYYYDDNLRLKLVETSRNGVTWDREAKYFYYLHGPLARVETGHDKVQGQDYYYTIQGWLRGMNSGTLNESRDPARDGYTGTSNWVDSRIGRDEIGFELGYFKGDYTPINAYLPANQPITGIQPGVPLDVDQVDLYNGNISYLVSAIRKFMTNPGDIPLFKRYRYDQLNRIKEMQVWEDQGLVANNMWRNSAASVPKYRTSYSFDRNGNLLNLTRNAGTGAAMDNLSYHYASTNGMLNNNRLLHVNDAVSPTGLDDLQDQGTYVAGNSSTHNYAYDETGNLVRDTKENISNIQWNLSGKVSKITKTAGSLGSIEFGYDAMGMRIEKSTQNAGLGANDPKDYTYYVHDAQGTPIAMYTREVVNGNSTEYRLTELGIFGSKRIGMLREDLLIETMPYGGGGGGGTKAPAEGSSNDLATSSQQTYKVEPIPGSGPLVTSLIFDHRIGERMYELSEHRGNVWSVVTDRRIPKDINANSLADYYLADNISSLDYYPFGMQMPGREYSGDEYRYGFQGQERDDEVNGNGNSWNYKYRMHDPRVGRFFAVDPLAPKYPHYSSFSFSGNQVIDAIEMEGLEPWGAVLRWGRIFEPTLSLPRIALPVPPRVPIPRIAIPNIEQLVPESPSMPQFLRGPGGSIEIPRGVDVDISPEAIRIPSMDIEIIYGQRGTTNIGTLDDPMYKDGYKTKKTSKEFNEKVKDNVPDWADGHQPRIGESGKQFAKRLMDAQKGEGNWKDTGPGSEFSKIKKWGDNHFKSQFFIQDEKIWNEIKDDFESYDKDLDDYKEQMKEYRKRNPFVAES
ncbi:MAG: hypothetical protein H6581_10805 [Bacteroidia bacterium]|nr:hypothetical protein [Bacteroidia bacterium]